MADEVPARAARFEWGLLLLLFGGLLLVGLGSIGFVDYDEAAYVESARQMHVSGDLLTSRVEGKPFFEKPPLLYWSMIASFEILGTNEWGGRIPSAIATLLTVFLVWTLLRRAGRPEVALPAALVFGLGIGVFLLGRLALTDASLTLLTTAAIVTGYLAATRDGGATWSSILLFGVSAGLAILAKGPVGLLLPAAVLGAFLFLRGRLREGLRRMGAGRAVLVALAVAAPWFVIMTLEHGTEFLREFLLEHNLERFTKEKEGHGGTPLYYVPVLLVGFFPWVVLLPRAVIGSWPRRGSGMGEDGAPRELDARVDLPFFALVWATIVLVFFSVSGTKLPQYIAPAYPALAVLVGLVWIELRGEGDLGRRLVWPVRILSVLAAVMGALLLAVPALVGVLRARLPAEKVEKNPFLLQDVGAPAPLLALGIALLAGGLTLPVLRRRSPQRVLPALAAGMTIVLLLVVVLGPSVDGYMMRPLRDLARDAGRMLPPGEPVRVLGLRRVPSVGFYAARPYDPIRKEKDAALRGLVEAGEPFAGVAPRKELERLREIEGIRVVREEGGYVLFAGNR